ncbi:MAG: RsbRD N-terminal domain-containing protein [Deltaproteobacteria bacterium]|nr:RsbRD N-terminal domain-containing protein [Deltaproteobacteria bacterium]
MKSLNDLLLKHKDEIIDRWFEQTLDSYQRETALFFKRESNQFANPVGKALREGIKSLFESLLEDFDSERICNQLNEIIKIRAVQDFSPSRAISFVFDLKTVVRSALGQDLSLLGVDSELNTFETRIDQVALFAFDIFARCREQLYALRVDEVKRSVSGVMKRLESCGSQCEPILDKSDNEI